MKKIVVLMLVLCMLFSFTACGGNGKEFDTVAEYVKSDVMQDELKGIKESLAESGMDIEIVGEDNKLVYVYTFTTQLEVNDTMTDALASALDAQTETFENVANAIKLVVDVEDPSVVVRYLNADSTLIYEQEFAAK